MTTLTKRLLPLRRDLPPTTPTIRSGEYGRALLAAYEKAFGPAIGTDVAYAVERYAKDGGYFPPIDAGREGLLRMQVAFSKHLQQNVQRFSKSFGTWLKKVPASFTAVTINSAEAYRHARVAIVTYLLDLFDNSRVLHENCVVPLTKLLDRPDDLSAAMVASCTRHIDDYYARTEFIHARRNMTLLAYYKLFSFAEEARREISSFHHEVGIVAHRIIDQPDFIAEYMNPFASSFDVGELSRAINSWHIEFARLALTVYRLHLAHTLEQIDREVLMLLEDALSRYENDATNDAPAAWARLLDTFKLTDAVRSLEQANETMEDVGESWDERLIGMRRYLENSVPYAGEMLADISHTIHSIRAHRGRIGYPLMMMGQVIDSASSTVSSPNQMSLATMLATKIEAWRSGLSGLANDTKTMPALNYARRLGARIAEGTTMNEHIDEQILRKIFTYAIGNANDFPREAHEYPVGKSFQVTVTVREDAIEIRDNGRGMTPERLTEVRWAIEQGHELISDHGGTGRGLAIDVGQHLLPKLFPNSSTPATLSIDSTLGVGTVVTIHYPLFVVK